MLRRCAVSPSTGSLESRYEVGGAGTIPEGEEATGLI